MKRWTCRRCLLFPCLFLECDRCVPWMMRELFAAAHKRFSEEQTKFRQVEFDTDVHLCACARRQSLGFQQTSSGWNDESLARCICFLHILERSGGRNDGGAEGELLLICSMQSQHLTNFLQPFKCLPPWLICASSRCPTECAHRGTVQCKWDADLYKGTFGSESSAFRRKVCPVIAMLS